MIFLDVDMISLDIILLCGYYNNFFYKNKLTTLRSINTFRYSNECQSNKTNELSKNSSNTFYTFYNRELKIKARNNFHHSDNLLRLRRNINAQAGIILRFKKLCIRCSVQVVDSMLVE